MKVHIATIEGESGNFFCLGAYESYREAKLAANKEAKKRGWVVRASVQTTVLHNADMKRYQRLYSASRTATDMYKARVEVLERLVYDMQNELPSNVAKLYEERVKNAIRKDVKFGDEDGD